jgi:hypothetical protein
MLGSEDTKELLRELVKLGLDNDTYRNFIHHAKHPISAMLNYGAAEYEQEGNNVLLHRKLDWMLRTYRDEWKLPRGRTDVFVALAKAAGLGMR